VTTEPPATKSKPPKKTERPEKKAKPEPLTKKTAKTKDTVSLNAAYAKWNNFTEEDSDDDEKPKDPFEVAASKLGQGLDGRYCSFHQRYYYSQGDCPWCTGEKKFEPPKKKKTTTKPKTTTTTKRNGPAPATKENVAAARAAAAAAAKLPGTDPRRVKLRDDMILEALRFEREASCDVTGLRTARKALEKRVKDDRQQNDVIESLKKHIDTFDDDDVSFHSCFQAFQRAAKFMPEDYVDTFKEAVALRNPDTLEIEEEEA